VYSSGALMAGALAGTSGFICGKHGLRDGEIASCD
jgi:hypothetical protein